MENSIRIKNYDVYRIEVNDAGDYIEFNLLDVDLPFKFINCGEKIQNRQEEYYNQSREINENFKEDDAGKAKAMHELDTAYCSDLRSIFDELLGENACQKIFGSTNTIGMFDELFDELTPHFEKMKLKHDTIQKNIFEKYKNRENDVI